MAHIESPLLSKHLALAVAKQALRVQHLLAPILEWESIGATCHS
jgi:hypothetical protein